MKPYFVVVLALLVSQGFGQATPARPSAPAPNQSSPAAAEVKPVAPGAAVITVDGVCDAANATGGECKTVITRAEFEKLMSVLSRQRSGQALQSIPPEAKRQLAIQYSRLLLFGGMAEKQGLQNTSEGKELLHFLRLQALTEEFSRALQEKSAPTAQEVQSFYEHNPERYTEWDLQRIVIPLRAGENQARKEELRKLADGFRQRASRGGDFNALQREAYEKAGMTDPPAAKLVLMPGALLPEGHSAVYRLKPGELSQVIEDATGFFIYKLDSSNLVSLDKNKADIEQFLAGQRAQETIRKVMESNQVHLNTNYFEPAPENAATNSSVRPIKAAAVREGMHK